MCLHFLLAARLQVLVADVDTAIVKKVGGAAPANHSGVPWNVMSLYYVARLEVGGHAENLSWQGCLRTGVLITHVAVIVILVAVVVTL